MKILECVLNGIFLQRLMAKVLVMALVAQLNALLQELAYKDCTTIDNRPTEKGLETRNFLAISHSGACYDHVI